MTAGVVRMDASPISVVAASARTTLGDKPAETIETTLDTLSREGFDASHAAEKARALPRKTWMIVAAGIIAWAIVAIPAWILFG